MVKKTYKTIILFIILGAAAFIFSCSNDFFGLVASTDLDERLKSKNDFPFLDGKYIYGEKEGDDRNWTELKTEDEYKFLIVTDTHMEDRDDFGLKKIKGVIDKYNDANTVDIKFAINLGDITQHGTEHDIDMFIEIADSLGIPFYPVIGNHDFYFGNWSVWKEKIGSTNYKLEIRDEDDVDIIHTTLLILDTGNAFFGKRQLDWLETEVKKANSKHIFVFTHAALFTTGIKMQQVTDTRERARVASILKDKADIMFSGHSHQRAINEAGNVRYITFEDFKSTGIYIIVHVKKSGVSYSFEKL